MTSIVNRTSQRETCSGEGFELTNFDRIEIDEPSVQTKTEIDLSNVPVDSSNLNFELAKTAFVSVVRNSLKLTGNVDSKVYRGLTYDSEGNLKFNQFKRVNAIINDETRTIGERLKELFRRDGVTIGALITAIGMKISTIVLAIMPHGSPSPTPYNDKGYIDRVKTAAKNNLIKLANFLLDLAKKALTALPGLIGSVVRFLLKRAGEAVLFLSEHLIIFLALPLATFEFIRPYIRKIRPKP